jgi:LPXTG-site transpeptidase (sortase) family protein
VDQPPLKLDSAALSGRMRHGGLGPGYVRRPLPRPANRIHDVHTPANKLPISYAPPAPAPPKQPAPSPVASPSQPAPALATQAAGRPVLLYAMASVLFITGLAISLAGFKTNHVAQAQVNKLSTISPSDEDAPPSTSSPSTGAVNNYKPPAPDLPRYIDIPALRVHARVYQVDTTKTGALATPRNIYDTAWYSKSSKPGQAGAMLIDGHSGLEVPGVFNGLAKLKPGDIINIKQGDSKVFTYTMVKSKVYPAASVDMSSLLISADTAKPGLNLITCSGDVIPGTLQTDQRLAIYAVEQ